MARILYLVAGEGNGHATRSAAVIEELKARGHEVVAVSDRTALSMLGKVADRTIEAVTPRMQYQNNAVTAWGTLTQNVASFPRALAGLVRVWSFARSWKPNIIVTDFNPMAAFLWGAPIVSIDNQHLICQAKIDVPKGCLIEYLKSWFVVKALVPRAQVRVITSFADVPVRMESVRVGPILSTSIRSLKPSKGRHLVVYQTTPTNQLLARLLPSLNVEIAAYGFGKVGKEGKVRFMPFDDKGWRKDLASCRAVVVNGGFSLITEALYLHKPVLCFPIKHQFEQILNAYYVEKSGCGIWAKEISALQVEAFIKKIGAFEKKMARMSWANGAQEAVEIVEQVLRGDKSLNP